MFLKMTAAYSTDLILENLLDGVLIVDRNGIILLANKAAGHIFNQPADQLIGQPFGFPVTPFDIQEIEVVRREKILTIQMLASKLRWRDTDAYLLSLRDISKLKKVEHELHAERRKLELTNLENEQYASLASHDLKEPVRKILIYSDWLMNMHPSPPDQRILNRVEKIHKAARRMQSLMSGIAEYSRLTVEKNSPVFVPVNLYSIVREVCHDLEIIIREKEAQITIDALPSITAIPVQMHQLFMNIISNALKYSKSDTRPHIRIDCRNSENFVEITISDNGIGFESRFAEQIFHPFNRLHSGDYEGSGIGLAICKKIVNLHGGTIRAKSIPGDGSVFIFTLRRIPEPETDFPDFGAE